MGKGGQEEEEEKEKEEKEEVMLLKGIHLLLQWETQLHTWQQLVCLCKDLKPSTLQRGAPTKL